MTITPTASNTLLFTAGENSREFVEIEDNLFQQVGEGTKLAFQENSEKEVTGLVVDGLPFMSLFKTPFYFSSAFNINLLGLAMLMFVGVILKLLFQWRAHRELQGHTKQVVRSAVITSVTNITFVLTGLVVVTITSPKLMFEIPLVFKLWLWIPIIATLAGIYHAYNAVIVWKEGLLAGKWARVRYSLVAAGALFMIWFYYFWNLLGFHYYS
jgi:hypothetical protein